MIALSVEIENTFSIDIDNIDILSAINTFGDVIDLVNEHIWKRVEQYG